MLVVSRTERTLPESSEQLRHADNDRCMLSDQIGTLAESLVNRLQRWCSRIIGGATQQFQALFS